MSKDSKALNTPEASPRERADNSNYRERVYQIVRQIPAGRVMTYGQIAEILGAGYDARTIGYAMHSAPEDVAWQRVINAQGGCSTGRVVLPANKQQMLLEAEGVEFNDKQRCNLERYRWSPEVNDATHPNDKLSEDAQPTLFS